ncbi:MAG: glyoxalase [Crocinitomicaceae bacterium]|nr:glyoxalase [Crocinitomicaceae bacterium]|tara:strand:- start:18871 stop:19305 length:435 start_codon:yes stop_codon:yes gene_type:complete
MKPIIDHIQVTVKDLAVAEPFYDQLLSILGFDMNLKSRGRVEAHDFDVVEYVHSNLTIGINSPREVLKDEPIHRRKPGAVHHIAFKAESREQIDELYPKIKSVGANIVEPPQYYPQHGESYYALFFKDLEGIKYELVYEERDFE